MVLGEIQRLLTPKVSGYLMETIGVIDDLRTDIRNVPNGKNGDSERRKES